MIRKLNFLSRSIQSQVVQKSFYNTERASKKVMDLLRPQLLVDVEVPLYRDEPTIIQSVIDTGVDLTHQENVHQLVYETVKNMYPEYDEGSRLDIEMLVNRRLDQISNHPDVKQFATDDIVSEELQGGFTPS